MKQDLEEKKYYDLLKSVFTALAPFYNLMTLPLRRARRLLVSVAGLSPGSTILDVATGTGEQALAFAKKGCAVTGVDLSDAMLDVAHRSDFHNRVEFVKSDVSGLPFDDDAFDASCVSFALHDMIPRIREKALREMTRVTKPDGTIMIVDYALPANKVEAFLMYQFVRLYEGYIYEEFIKIDLNGLLERCGMRILGERSILAGAGKILKCKNKKAPTLPDVRER